MKILYQIFVQALASIAVVLVCLLGYGYVLVYPAPLPTAEITQYDTDTKRLVFAECMNRIKTLKDHDKWSVAVHECGELARWESSI